ncbi:hypothetical protein HMPREF1551_02677 [Capnocytophaga sp. oral taxon 863 str. F0517]|nr:hypothetical protein HMPREF1551_02677 [Capnocytophaga sp. oral taxon 863 str. F0517]
MFFFTSKSQNKKINLFLIHYQEVISFLSVEANDNSHIPFLWER